MNFYIADLHIGHANIIKHDNRPFFGITEMSERIIRNWNRTVKTNDTVYILGDFIWKSQDEWTYYVEPLAGKKVLIRGNHDPIEFLPEVKRLFQEITNLKEVIDNNRNVIMCHYPIPFCRKSASENAYMLYGHVHQTKEYEYIKELRKTIQSNHQDAYSPTGNFINIGAMMPYMDYTPRTLDELIKGDKEYRTTAEYIDKKI